MHYITCENKLISVILIRLRACSTVQENSNTVLNGLSSCAFLSTQTGETLDFDTWKTWTNIACVLDQLIIIKNILYLIFICL